MTNLPRRRGRPEGTENNDDMALAAIADMIAANDRLKPTTAMRRYNPKANDAEIRRLQDKWKNRKKALMEAAATRLAQRKQSAAYPTDSGRNIVFNPTAIDRPVSAALKAALDLNARTVLHDHPELKAALSLSNSAVLQHIEVYNRPEMQKVVQLFNDPAVRLWREQKRVLDIINPYGL